MKSVAEPFRLQSIETTRKSSLNERIVNAARSSNTKVISFDVFDTAILRPFLDPKDVFRFMTPAARSITGIATLNFADQRALAEKGVRQSLTDTGKRRDPTIAEIYDELATRIGIARPFLDSLLQFEIQTEVRLAYRHEAIYDLYHQILEIDKPIIFCSDTYLPHDSISEMLRRVGYTGHDRVFVSSEENATKKHGELFQKVAMTLGVSPSEIVHIGDNRKSDIDNASANGFRPYRILSPKDRFSNSKGPHRSFWAEFKGLDLPIRGFLGVIGNRLYGEELSNSIPDQLFGGNPKAFGYYALGPFLYGLLVWISQRAKSAGIDHIFFLSRDGYLPLAAWNALGLSGTTGIKASYLNISRRSVLPISLRMGDLRSSLFSMPVATSTSIENFLVMRLGDEAYTSLKPILTQSGIDLSKGATESSEALISVLNSHKDAVMAGIEKSASAALAYFRGAIDQSATPALFDVGRKGTFQKLLSSALERKIHGLYVVTEGAIAENVSAADHDSFFGQVARSLLQNEPDSVIYEALLSETGPSTRAYSESGQVLFEEKQHDDRAEQLVHEIQTGALQFVADIRSHFGNDLDRYRFNPRVLNHALWNFWNSPADAKILDALSHEDSLFSADKKPLANYYDAPKAELIDPVPIERHTRVCIYCPAMLRIPGGIERVVSYLAKYLTDRGYHLEILTSGRPSTNAKPVYPLPPKVAVKTVDVRSPSNIRSIIKAFRPDAVVVMASGAFVKNFVKALETTTIPLMLAERADPLASQATYWADEEHLYFKTYARADLVSVQLKSFTKPFSPAVRGRIAVLPNPVPQLPMAPQSEKKKIIACVARIRLDQKQQDLLVRAFALIAAKYPDWSVHLYGAEHQQDGDILRKLIAEKGLRDRVLMKSTTNDILQVLRSASIFAIPSSFEGFPNALAEAMSAGIPAVGLARCPGTNELIINAKNGFLVSGTDEVRGFADALAKLIESPELRFQMGTAAQESLKRYSAKKTLKAWRTAIDRLVAKKVSVRVRRAKPLAIHHTIRMAKKVYKAYSNRTEKT